MKISKVDNIGHKTEILDIMNMKSIIIMRIHLKKDI